MPDRFVETHIRQLPLFAQLPPEQLRWAMDAFRVMRFEPGETIFAQGEPSQGLYMLVNGLAELVRTDGTGRRNLLATVGPMQYLNEAALFREGTETASLIVTERATVLTVPRQRLATVVAHHPEMRQYLPVSVNVQQEQRREQVFQGQRPNETVLLLTRRHWWALARQIWLPGVVAGSILILASFIPSALLQLACGGMALVIPGVIILYLYLEWRNDQVIVTNQRLIHIERTIHSMETTINQVNLESIHEVNADIVTSDPFSRIFQYGTIEIKTAGEAGNIRLTVIPDPDGIQDTILQNRVRQQAPQEREQRNVIRAEVDKALGREGGAVVESRPAELRPVSVYRKHQMYWLRGVIVPGMLALFALVFTVLTLFAGGFGVLGPMLGFLLFLISGIGVYWADWDWRNDLYIVGDEIIQLIHRRPLFLQNEDDQVLLSSVDNVLSEKKGLLQSLLNYGDVKISLIGGDKDDAKVFRAVPNPQKVQAEITLRQARIRNRDKEEEERRRRDEIAEYISVYHETVSSQGGSTPQTPAAQVSGKRPPQDGTRPPGVPRRRP